MKTFLKLFIFSSFAFISCEQKKTIDQPTSSIEYFNEPGMVKSIMELKDGKPHGLYLEMDKSGNLINQYQYLNGNLEGVQYIYDRYGDYSTIVHYSNGLKEGQFKKYYKGGRKTQEESTFRKDKKDGVATWFFNNKKHEKSTIFNFKNGVLDGPAEKYYESGALKAKATYSNGELVGDWETFEDIAKNE